MSESKVTLALEGLVLGAWRNLPAPDPAKDYQAAIDRIRNTVMPTAQELAERFPVHPSHLRERP